MDKVHIKGMANLHTTLAAALALAITFTLNACGSDSNNAEKYSYCVYMEQQTCLSGPFETCANGGTPSNSCPTGYDVGSQPSSSSGGGDEKGNSISNYKTVKIGNQTWMAENLNYAVEGSVCYDNLEINCDKYGRLYTWMMAMDIDAKYVNELFNSNEKHRGICPVGWHIPNDDEWDILIKYADPNWISNTDNVAGTKLKSKSGWNNTNDGFSGNGDDKFGFMAFPSGACECKATFGSNQEDGDNYYDVGKQTYLWSSSDYAIDLESSLEHHAYAYAISYNRESSRKLTGGLYKGAYFSVRCVKD
jgi:uncharacterized protein (TIGR02145 family)